MKQTERITRKGQQGYLVVNLRNGKNHCVFPVHRLVADAFIPNPDNLPTVNHKDGNKHNNCVDNLEWMSYTDNNVHALINNLRRPRHGVVVEQYDKNGRFVKRYKTLAEASKKTGLNYCSISHCVCGLQTRTCDGSMFVRVQEGVTTIPHGSTPEVATGGSAPRP